MLLERAPWQRIWLEATSSLAPQSYSHKELNPANNLQELGRGLQAVNEKTV